MAIIVYPEYRMVRAAACARGRDRIKKGDLCVLQGARRYWNVRRLRKRDRPSRSIVGVAISSPTPRYYFYIQIFPLPARKLP